MKRSEAYKGNYLRKEDVDPPVIATIGSVKQEMIKGDHGDELKVVVSFIEPSIQPMILNGCNWDSIERSYGEESDDWVGKKIELYCDPNVMFGSKRVGGIRVRTGAAPAQEEGFGDPNNLTFSDAVKACEEVGISKEQLVLSLKAKGCEGYNSARDSDHVRQIIDNVKNRPAVDPFDPLPASVTGDDVPF